MSKPLPTHNQLLNSIRTLLLDGRTIAPYCALKINPLALIEKERQQPLITNKELK